MTHILLQTVEKVPRKELESFVEEVAPQSKKDIFSDYEGFSKRYQGIQLGAILVDLGAVTVESLPRFLKSPFCSVIPLPSLEEIHQSQKWDQTLQELEQMFIDCNLRGSQRGESLMYLSSEELEKLQKMQTVSREKGLEIPLCALSLKQGTQTIEEIQQVFQEILREKDQFHREGQIPQVAVGEGRDPLEMALTQPPEENGPCSIPLDSDETAALDHPPLSQVDLSPPQLAPLEEAEPLPEAESLAEPVAPLEDLESVEAMEDLESVEAMDTLESIEAMDTLESVEAMDTLEPVEGTGELDKIEKLEGLETVSAMEPLERPDPLAEVQTRKSTTKIKIRPGSKLSPPSPAPVPTAEMVKELAEQVTRELTKNFSAENLAEQVAQLLSTSKEAETKTGEKVEINGKKYTILRGADLQEAMEKAKPIRGAYIPTLKLAGTIFSKKVQILNSLVDWTDLEGVTFEKDVDFKGTHFRDKAKFKGACFLKKFQCQRATFAGGADFAEVNFEHEVNFNGTQFDRYVSFRKITFQKKAVFTKNRFIGGANFDQSVFNKETSFSETSADYRFTLTKCRFLSSVTFSNSTYKDMCDFSEAQFDGEAKYLRVTFDGPAKFTRSKFKGPADFKGTYFLKDVFFHSTEFSDKTDFSGVQGEGNVFFQGMKSTKSTSFVFSHVNISRMFLERGQVENHIHAHRTGDYDQARRDYGLLKNNFREINSYNDEDWAYYMEKKMARYTLPSGTTAPLSSVRRLFEWIALDLGCGYGTKPINILFVSMAVIVLFAGFFTLVPGGFVGPAGVDSSQFGFMDGLVTSFKAFTGSEVGEWHARATHHLLTLFVMCESFLGIFIVTVLVVTFSRKVIR